MNKLECINAFIQVVEENGFAAAARKQKVSTAAISRQIKLLESHLGIGLLKRTTRHITLTEPGRLYYEECKQTLAGLMHAETIIKSSQVEIRGQLHILCNPYFAETYIIPKLHSFMQKHPLLTIKLELAERFPDFNKEAVDVAFGISMDGPQGLVRRQVAKTRYVLCASPSYLKQHGIPKTPAELIKHHYITHTMRQPDNVLTFDDNLEISVKPVLWLNDTRTMCEAAQAGLGLVRLHDYVVQEAIKAGNLTELLPEYHRKSIPIYLYYQKNRFLQPKIRKCIDYFTV